MMRDLTSRELPRLTRLNGDPVGWLLAGPPGVARLWRRCAARLRRGELPGMIAIFADGRRFALETGDLGYEDVYRLGSYEPVVTETIRALLHEGDVVVDVGANHGWYSLMMAAAVGPTGHVYAIEPLVSRTPMLQQNLALNQHLQVDVHAVAVGERDGELELRIFAGLPLGHTSAAPLTYGPYETTVVPRRRLDNVVLEQPVLVKIDVEGYEPEVLAGAVRMLEHSRPPIWVIEVNNQTAAAFGRSPSDALASLAPSRYAILRVDQHGVHEEPDTAATPTGTTWLCIPNVHSNRLRAVRRLLK